MQELTTMIELQDVDRIHKLDNAGICVSLNSDDPEEFESGYLTNMLILFQEASGYFKVDIQPQRHCSAHAL
jgi:adenosine deaminase